MKINDQDFKALISRVALAQSMSQTFDGKRDIYNACGWPEEIIFKQYWHRYKRQGMARRIINAPVGSVWRGKPVIEEQETPGKETQFEQDVTYIIDKLNLYQYCSRVDRLAGIGEYAVLFLGFSGDGDLDEEVKPGEENKLMYFSVYSQEHAEIEEYNEDPKSERFGLPEIYSIDFNRSLNEQARHQRKRASIGKRRVHWTRIIHVADELLEGDVFGQPRLECVWNNLLSLELITGGSAEMFWQGAFQGLGFKAQPDAEFGEEEKEAMIEEIESYLHGLQRHLRLRGVDIEQLAPQVSDPTSHIEAQITQISAATGIPKRILTGSERGELSSSQDQENWEDRVDERRRDYAEPVILRPIIDRLIELKAIAEPVEGYSLEWPDIKSLSLKEQRGINKDRVGMIKDYMSAPGTETMVPEDIFLREFVQLDENTIEECMKSIQDYWDAEEAKQDQDDQTFAETEEEDLDVGLDDEQVEIVQNLLRGVR